MQLLPYWHVPSWWYLHGSRSTVPTIFTLAANFAQSTHARLWVVAPADIDAAHARDLQLFSEADLRALDEYFLDCASESITRINRVYQAGKRSETRRS